MKDNIPHHRVDQYGFTLIELMISLVLGLLISAAVMQVFLTSQRVDRIQTAASEIQDKAVFGLQAIESQVRLANLGNDGVPTNDTTALGGIVLTAGDYDGNGGEGSGGEGSGGEGSGENGNDKDDKDDKKKKEELEKEAKEKEKEAEEKEKEAKEKEKEAEEKEKEAKEKEKEAEEKEKEADNMSWWDKLWGKDREKRAEAAKKRAEAEAKRAEAEAKRTEAEAKRAEAEAKRAEAEAKRAEAAKIGNKTAYNFRDIQPSAFQNANFQNSKSQRPIFQRANFQTSSFRKIGFQRTGFQKVALSSASGSANVMVKDGLSTGYLTRSGSMTSEGGNNKWNSSLSNTNQLSDQLTIQYINTTGRTIYDCEGAEVLAGERVISRYFVTDGTGTGSKARKNLNLRCDAGRITSEGKLEKFMDSGETIIENIDQFNIRLGVQSLLDKSDPSNYQYADMTVAEYMALSGEKPAITNIRIAILARSTANSPEASADKFMIFGKEQSLKDQNDAPKYLRRVYESNILLRNARIMRIINTTVT